MFKLLATIVCSCSPMELMHAVWFHIEFGPVLCCSEVTFTVLKQTQEILVCWFIFWVPCVAN